jgi:hypothetical protein
MGETDWTYLSDALDAASLDRGSTTGETPPSGGGSFVFGFNSLVTTQGAAGKFTNQTNFAPTPALKGGSIRGAIKRGVSAGDINFSPCFFMLCQGTSVNDHAYILGLSDEEPSHIVLVKKPIVEGLPTSPVALSDGVLQVSSGTYAKDTWLHLRLDAIVNLNGDVLLQAFANDLTSNDVASPVWDTISGMTSAFVDDQLGVNSQLAGVHASFYQPFTSGRMGVGFFTKDISRRGWFDHLECYRQN